MKNYKKTLLATLVLAAMPLFAATSSAPIQVTTFVDEDGENNSACSLREALKTAADRKSYGGCQVTDTSPATTKSIQLDAGTYVLDRELAPKIDIVIWGKSPVDWEKRSIITNDYPAQTALKTTIDARGKGRIFNTTGNNSTLNLMNIILVNGKTADRGGAIYAGGNVNLQNTQILDSQAAISGGAIFLAGSSSSLNIDSDLLDNKDEAPVGSLLKNNKAPLGSLLAMSCINDNVYSKRKIDISRSSLIANGSTDSSSMLDFCGEPLVTLSTNTIAQNTANLSNGSLIKFTGDSQIGSTPTNNSSILSNLSSINLLSNTIVENNAYSAFLYDKLGLKILSFNVLAYNNGGYSCRYLLGDVTEEKEVDIVPLYNAFSLNGASKCDLPKLALPEKHTNIDISAVNIRTLLTTLQPESESTAFLPLYYPVNTKLEKDLLNTGVTGCSATDQRNIARITDGTLHYDPDSRNSCDIGSVELMKLTAGDIVDVSNISLTTLLANYKNQLDFFNDLVKQPNNPDFLTYYKVRAQEYKNLYEKTQSTLKYRAIYIDLKNYQLPIPQETQQADGTSKLAFFNKQNYIVTTEPLGKGQINEDVENIDESDAENLVCEWNEDLEQIIFYRKDDRPKQGGDNFFCKYTIQYRADSSITSSGLISALFENIAPEAKDTSVTLKYQKKEKVAINLLNFANDYGDTGEGGKGPDSNPNKPQFWKNADGVELPIRLSNVPSENISVTADRKGSCPPGDFEKETCYGGNIYVQEINIFNPFKYSFNYQVFDADGLISNTATVKINSTANASGKGGGGSLNFLSIFGLFSLLAYRRMKK
ncbi:CSLREA domain protein [Acinetobacter sp. WC-323]|uniref:CSLREA domain-containing protein n=1 Tax=Acinetobacter sp. WC-323 TaxID=903918 RepID=UPI00029E6598|nr:CSLREA domain-containing protein [Acinetobacter sp. WC-323]EKU52735.1 CSLREA domain protein [Acinetobacter sp. WC-323]